MACILLVWYETSDDIQAHATRVADEEVEAAWKVDMIEQGNPQWKELYETLF